LIEPGVPHLIEDFKSIKNELDQLLKSGKFKILYVQNQILWENKNLLAELLILIPEIKVLQNE